MIVKWLAGSFQKIVCGLPKEHCDGRENAQHPVDYYIRDFSMSTLSARDIKRSQRIAYLMTLTSNTHNDSGSSTVTHYFLGKIWDQNPTESRENNLQFDSTICSSLLPEARTICISLLPEARMTNDLPFILVTYLC
jgi:hypothetical protein